MARGDVVMRRHLLEGKKTPTETKRIKPESKTMAGASSRDPQGSRSGAIAKPEPDPQPEVEVEAVVEEPKPKRRRKKD